MIKKSIIQRSLKKYNLNKKYLTKRQNLKLEKKIYKKDLKYFYIQKFFQSLPKDSCKIRFKRFCWKTGRTKGYYRNFGLSRHVIRELAYTEQLPGLTKSSW